MKKKFFLLPVLLTATQIQLAAQQWTWETVAEGKYSVGYKIIPAIDYGRPYLAEPLLPRVLPLQIWYPSLRKSGAKLSFIDFVRTDKNIEWGKSTAKILLGGSLKQYVDSAAVPATVTKLAAVKTVSVLNAAPAKGKHPVVMIGNGLTAPGYFYTLMAEYLASHGYVVVCYPNLPEKINAVFGFDTRGILNQVADLELALNNVLKLSFINKDELALAAWSVGGASQIVFQMKHKAAKAMISLDAASQYEYGRDLIKQSVYYDSTAFTAPFLNLTAAGPVQYIVPRSDFFADTLAVNVVKEIFPNLTHSNFLSFHQYVIWLTKNDKAVKTEYERMCERVRKFLDEMTRKKIN